MNFWKSQSYIYKKEKNKIYEIFFMKNQNNLYACCFQRVIEKVWEFIVVFIQHIFKLNENIEMKKLFSKCEEKRPKNFLKFIKTVRKWEILI